MSTGKCRILRRFFIIAFYDLTVYDCVVPQQKEKEPSAWQATPSLNNTASHFNSGILGGGGGTGQVDSPHPYL